MFDILDPAGSLGQKFLNIPKGGVQSTKDPESWQEMIANRIPGSQGGSFVGDIKTQAIPGGGNKSWAEKRQEQDATYAAQKRAYEGGMKKGGKVKLSAASKRADGIAVKGKTRGRIV